MNRASIGAEMGQIGAKTGNIRAKTREYYPSLLDCALLAINGSCPPERALYWCLYGEDDSECDCVRCWSTYLLYVANGRRFDPYANLRGDE